MNDMGTPSARIAVIFATAQGSTRDIAEYFGQDLTARGAEVVVAGVNHAPQLTGFDAIILGSAIHHREFLPPAASFIRAHADILAKKRVWLFSVGLGPALVGPIGRRLGRKVPKEIAALRALVAPEDYHAFAGHYERAGVDFKARTIYRLLGGTRYGDLRDWAEIAAWSAKIGESLGLPQTAVTIVRP